MVGIISNTSALAAQANLKKASAETQASITRLSSGYKIDRAAADVAGLAIGTILRTNISTLKAALSNTSQAKSLLGVADGALSNIGELLQRQKALATQATSGTLDNTTRGFLDQEFQNLKSEIDRISSTTNFNGIKLIDGSLYEPAELTTEHAANATQASGVITVVAAIADAKTIAINGVTFTAEATAPATSDPRMFISNVGAAADATSLFNAIQAVINSIDTTRADDKARLSGLDFTLSGATITVKTKGGGAVYNSGGAAVINVVSDVAASIISVNGTDMNGAGGTIALTAGGVSGVTGDLDAGTFATAGATAYSGTATTIVRGTISDTILTAIDDNAAAAGAGNATGVSTAGISNNDKFIGKISGFKANYSQFDRVDLSITVGDYTYTAKNVETTPAADTIIRMSSLEAGGGFFDLQVNDSTGSGQSAVTDQDDANDFAARLNKAVEGLDIFQIRTIKSYSGTGSIFPTGSTTQSGNLTGTTFKMINNDFSDLKIEKIKVEAPVTGGTEALIEITVNGEVFRSGYSNVGATTALGSSIAASGSIGLVSTTDPRKIIQFTNGATQIDITDSAEAQGFQAALERAFGVGEGGSSLSFQVGVNTSDVISVSVRDSGTENIYRDDDGNVITSLGIGTLVGANEAGSILDNAINTVTAIRADIGALQSRFDYASANVESSIQNQDLARSTFLDTDVADESTKFAGAQVRLQASISVLAQANQIPMQLMKLING
jgi:flagellin